MKFSQEWAEEEMAFEESHGQLNVHFLCRW